MIKNKSCSKPSSYEFELSEAIYWGKLFENQVDLGASRIAHNGAMACLLPGIDILAMNRVIGWGFSQKESQEDLQLFIEYYKRNNCKRFFLQLSPEAPQINSLRELLKANGFTYYNTWLKLGRCAMRKNPFVTSFLNCRQIGLESAETYGQILMQSFSWTEKRLVDFLASSVGKPGYQQYLVYLDGKAIAAGALHTYNQYGSMAFAGTLPQYRGIGAQSLLIHTRLNAAQQLGIHYLFSETANHTKGEPSQSYQNLHRFGFDLIYPRENWIYTM